ncbi:MAG: hypothetical protein ACP5T1_06860 [Thermoplasmata archaeon]
MKADPVYQPLICSRALVPVTQLIFSKWVQMKPENSHNCTRLHGASNWSNV